MHQAQFILGMLLLTQAAAAVAAQAVAELPAYSRDYDAERNPFADGRDALALARRSGRLVMIEVGGDWCLWCRALDGFIKANSAVYDRLHQNFVLLKVNTSEANDNAKFLAGLPRTNGYPHVFISRDDGGLIGSTDTTRLIVNGRYDAQRLLAFLDHWIERGAVQRSSSNLPRNQ